MTPAFDPSRDLRISRVIRARPDVIWQAWTDPRKFEQWWIPAPALCRVVAMDLRPGGALTTQMSEGGGPFVPHLDACFLELVEHERLVFTNALVAGWRPAPQPFMTAIITLAPHAEGTEYTAHVMHRDHAHQAQHAQLGFEDGWGTVIGQLARLVEVTRAADR